jgi:ribosomal protein S27AE
MFGVKNQVSQAQAGYMELEGAEKDGRCKKVAGEISRELGCCNLFGPEAAHTKKFSCGTCEYVKK